MTSFSIPIFMGNRRIYSVLCVCVCGEVGCLIFLSQIASAPRAHAQCLLSVSVYACVFSGETVQFWEDPTTNPKSVKFTGAFNAVHYFVV